VFSFFGHQRKIEAVDRYDHVTLYRKVCRKSSTFPGTTGRITFIRPLEIGSPPAQRDHASFAPVASRARSGAQFRSALK